MNRNFIKTLSNIVYTCFLVMRQDNYSEEPPVTNHQDMLDKCDQPIFNYTAELSEAKGKPQEKQKND